MLIDEAQNVLDVRHVVSHLKASVTEIRNYLIVNDRGYLRLGPSSVSWVCKLILRAYKHCNWDLGDVLDRD